ncbi:MAG: hypothetical protein O2960_14135 [Verrucomicrobia bacterium]|nr:hypothetical protein [Verrucomicrobiota bacterium]
MNRRRAKARNSKKSKDSASDSLSRNRKNVKPKLDPLIFTSIGNRGRIPDFSKIVNKEVLGSPRSMKLDPDGCAQQSSTGNEQCRS